MVLRICCSATAASLVHSFNDFLFWFHLQWGFGYINWQEELMMRDDVLDGESSKVTAVKRKMLQRSVFFSLRLLRKGFHFFSFSNEY